MKKAFLFFSFASLSFQASALPEYDPFEDPSGSDLAGQTNLTGHTWNVVGSQNTLGAKPVIAAGSLSYPGLPASTSNSVFLTSNGSAGQSARFALGTSDQTTESNAIEVSASDPLARISPHEVPTCRPSIPAGEESPERTSNATPYVRIWFSPPSERRAAPDLDPTVRERLRALGYSW